MTEALHVAAALAKIAASLIERASSPSPPTREELDAELRALSTLRAELAARNSAFLAELERYEK